MMQRLRDALQRGFSDAPPDRQYRPNELRLEAARAERLRREGQRLEPAARRPRPSPEERPRRREPTVAAPAGPTRPAPTHVTALKTRSGLRQAWLLKEILSPPMALRGRQNVDNEL